MCHTLPVSSSAFNGRFDGLKNACMALTYLFGRLGSHQDTNVALAVSCVCRVLAVLMYMGPPPFVGGKVSPLVESLGQTANPLPRDI